MPQSRMKTAAMPTIVTPAQIEGFHRDGFLILRGALKESTAFHALTPQRFYGTLFPPRGIPHG